MTKRLLTLVLSLIVVDVARGDALADRVAALESRVARVEQAAGVAAPAATTLDGYVKVADENGTYDVGPTPTSIAFGVPAHFVVRVASGNVTYSNAAFGGDPAISTHKFGYVLRATPSTTPAAVVAPAIVPTTRAATQATAPIAHGGISDDGDVAAVSTLYREVGWTTARVWVGLTATGDCDEGQLRTVNAYLAQGIVPRIVLTPPGGVASVPYPTAAIVKIERTLDRRVGVNLVNESNSASYWPGGDWLAAARWSDGVAAELQRAGYSCGTPSLTGYASQWAIWHKQIVAAGLASHFDRVVAHIYPEYQGHNANDDRDGWLADFEAELRQADACRQLYATTLGRPIALDIDEWGLGQNVSDDSAAYLLPRAYALLAKYNASSAYFIATNAYDGAGKPRLPHSLFAWLVDRTTGQRREAIVAAIRTALVPTTRPTTRPLVYVAHPSSADAPAGTTGVWVEMGSTMPSIFAGGWNGPKQDLADDATINRVLDQIKASGATLVAFDIEDLDWRKPADVAKVARLLDLARARLPGVALTAYAIPVASYWGLVNDDSAALAQVRATNDALAPVIARCDVLSPSLYLRYPDADQLKAGDTQATPAYAQRDATVLRGAFAECRRLDPSKPILCWQMLDVQETRAPLTDVRLAQAVATIRGLGAAPCLYVGGGESPGRIAAWTTMAGATR